MAHLSLTLYSTNLWGSQDKSNRWKAIEILARATGRRSVNSILYFSQESPLDYSLNQWSQHHLDKINQCMHTFILCLSNRVT